MATKKINKYRVWCNDDSRWEELWLDENDGDPANCPTNATHVIDTTKTSVLETVSSQEVIATINEEVDSKTGGHYQGSTQHFDMTGSNAVNQGEWFEGYFSFPIPVSLLTLSFTSFPMNENDIIELDVFPNFHYGTHLAGNAPIQNLAANVGVGESTLIGDAVCMEVFKTGYFISITDGTNTEDLGRVTGVNTSTGAITTEFPTANAYLATTPTKLLRTVKMGYNYKIQGTGRYALGQAKIGGSYIPAGTPFRFRYKNVTGGDKQFTFDLEYLY